MITRAALELNGQVYVGAEGKRHSDVIRDMVEIHWVKPPVGGTQGFIDHNGAFLNRQDAAKHAFECGQLPHDKVCPEIILSGDL